MTRFPGVGFVAFSILALSVASAASAETPERAERLGRLAPGEYRVASIQAWPDDGSLILDAPHWERVEVREDGKKRKLVIHYKTGSASESPLLPRGPNSSPTSWHTNAFSVSPRALPNGDVRLRLNFCYRGCVYLTLQAKGATPVTSP